MVHQCANIVAALQGACECARGDDFMPTFAQPGGLIKCGSRPAQHPTAAVGVLFRAECRTGNDASFSGHKSSLCVCFAITASGRLARPPLGCSPRETDRKSTRLNSSHRCISYAVFCLKKKKNKHQNI